MPFRTACGFIVRATTFGEADRLLTLFTREVGLLRGVAKHAKKSLKRFGGRLEPLSRVGARYFEREGAGLVRFDSFEALHVPLGLAGDVRAFGTSAALLELGVVLSAERQAHPELFDLLERALDRIERGASPARVRTAFELRALALLGHAPGTHACAACRRAIAVERSTGERPAGLGFSPERGGLLCAACARSGREESLPVSPPVVRALSGSWTAVEGDPLDPPWGAGVYDALAVVLRSFIGRHLEVRLRADRFLDSLPPPAAPAGRAGDEEPQPATARAAREQNSS